MPHGSAQSTLFLGHFALGFAAKPAARKVSLGALFLACQLADLVWPWLVLAGVEVVEIAPGDTAYTPLHFTSYPWSHSLVALALWAVAFAGGYALVRRSGWRAALVLAALVLSHWVLDAVSHRPDVPLTLGGHARVGLGLWRSVPATLAVELGMFALGVGLYVRATVARDRIGRNALVGIVLFFVAVDLANAFGPPPPSASAVAWAAQSMWLLVLWGWWVDRHRGPRAARGAG